MSATLITQDATQDANGNWQQSGTSDYTQACRYEPAGPDSLIKGANGETLGYSGILYMPRSAQFLPFGTQVTVISSLDSSVSSASIYTPSNEVIEITTGDTGNVVDDSRLVGKRYSIERRAIGRLKANEWTYTSTGFKLASKDANDNVVADDDPSAIVQTVKAGETFFAYVYAVLKDVSVVNGVPEETVTVATVKNFYRGQLNVRVWL